MALRPDGRRLNPFRPVRWAAFLVEKTTFHAIGVTLKRQWPVFQMRQENGRDADIIIDHLPFRETGLRIENLVPIRNGDRFTVDLERRFRPGTRHVRARPSGGRRAIGCPWFHPTKATSTVLTVPSEGSRNSKRPLRRRNAHSGTYWPEGILTEPCGQFRC